MGCPKELPTVSSTTFQMKASGSGNGWIYWEIMLDLLMKLENFQQILCFHGKITLEILKIYQVYNNIL